MQSPGHESSSQSLSGALARSRSRYKRPRNDRPPMDPLGPRVADPEEVHQDEQAALPMGMRQIDSGRMPPVKLSPQQIEGFPEQGSKYKVNANNDSHSRSFKSEDKMRRKGCDKQMVEKELAPSAQLAPDRKYASRHQEYMFNDDCVREQIEARDSLPSPKQRSPERSEKHQGRRHRHKSGEGSKEPSIKPETTSLPAFDAPISAVNAGERRVTVKYEESVLSVPITPSTTPLDIVRFISKQLSKEIGLKSTILLESYRQLSLERPLRRYEHIRDVMNSWDYDAQNTFVIMPHPIDDNEYYLDLKQSPISQPGETSVQVYHSQRPGHWDKRWVTLRSDGQVVVTKDRGGEVVNICHLSDFDIYIPTARQLSKKIKPPRKMCYAVKSQQKSSMFMSTANFVHFFSTGDKALAAAWYKAVQGWRSWYLINVMGEGRQNPEIPGNDSNDRASWDVTNNTTPLNHPTAANGLSRGMSIRTRDPPPISYPKKLTKDMKTGAPTTRNSGPSIIQHQPTSITVPDPFAASGLLGRTYTLRRQAQREREHPEPPGMPPPNHPNPLNRDPTQQRPKPRPLVDLTPQFQEPPQHSRKGRGVRPEHIPAGGLVEVATTPAAAIALPPSTTWQRPSTSGSGSGDAATAATANIQRSRTLRRDRSAEPTTAPPPQRRLSTSPAKNNSNVPFTGGLLANTNSNENTGNRNHQPRCTGKGKGIRTGNRDAKEPMLDLEEERKYQPGSLLDLARRREGSDGREGAVVAEREKRREVDIAVGEGFYFFACNTT